MYSNELFKIRHTRKQLTEEERDNSGKNMFRMPKQVTDKTKQFAEALRERVVVNNSDTMDGSFECGCGNKLRRQEMIMHSDVEGVLTHWTGECDRCGKMVKVNNS